jgi:hypothetical protein
VADGHQVLDRDRADVDASAQDLVGRGPIGVSVGDLAGAKDATAAPPAQASRSSTSCRARSGKTTFRARSITPVPTEGDEAFVDDTDYPTFGREKEPVAI